MRGKIAATWVVASVILGSLFLAPVCSGQEFPERGIRLRFEEGQGLAFLDTVSGEYVGSFQPFQRSAAYSTDAPRLIDRENEFSANLTAGNPRFLLIDEVPFVFHDAAVGGAAGDASLEFLIKLADQSHGKIFWSNGDGGFDEGRYHYFWNASFLQVPNSERSIGCDRRLSESGAAEEPVKIGNLHPLTPDVWHSIVTTREILGDGMQQWRTYIDGEEALGHANITSANEPTVATWLIGGKQRGREGAMMLIDEVRMVPWALGQEEFTIIDREPDCPEELESPEVTCDDAIDNDCDGHIDALDSDCPSVGPFTRGDCDGNGVVTSPTEAIVLLNWVYRGGEEPGCLAACDAEANGTVNLTDAIRILRFMFLGRTVPDPPFPRCLTSALPTDVAVGCASPFCVGGDY